MSKNAEGWIRHRGGKCPVEIGTHVDVRYRGGHIDMDVPAQTIECHADNWLHTDDKNSFDARCDIMAYRLHNPVEQVEACSKPELRISLPENYGEIIGGSVEGPIQWRDRITEIDATTQALTAERANLVQKLASEGFAFIGRAVEPADDMSDPKNWLSGDMLIAKGDAHCQFTNGRLYEIKSVGKESVSIVVDDHGSKTNGWGLANWEWHSRPSA